MEKKEWSVEKVTVAQPQSGRFNNGR